MTFDHDMKIDIGALGNVSFPAGEYCYIGSAMRGLDQRLGRHFSKEKTIHWHIDRLTVTADHMEAYESYPEPILECQLVGMVETAAGEPVLNGFGCSDCDCRTHLFKMNEDSKRSVISAAKLKPYKPR